MTVLALDDVRFAATRGEPEARLFEWRGELYRAFAEPASSFHRSLFERGVIERLVARGLIVETELTNLTLPGYPLVLRHHRLLHVTYPSEWAASMLQDAALLVLELNMELARERLTTQDAHPWNVAFDGMTPVYLDFGSIAPETPATSWDAGAGAEFEAFFLRPLGLMSEGHDRLARVFLQGLGSGLRANEADYLAGFRPGRTLAARATAITRRRAPKRLQATLRTARNRRTGTRASVTPESRTASLEQLRQAVLEVQLLEPRSDWSEYYDVGGPGYAAPADWTGKLARVAEILERFAPQSVLDLGSNTGAYAELAAKLGASVVAADSDPASIERLYRAGRARKTPILPTVLDLSRPTPGQGWLNAAYLPASERLGSQLVLALALVHHLVLSEWASFDTIVDALCSFSRRWLVVEFVPPTDRYVAENLPRAFTWYSLDSFRDALVKRCRILEELSSDPLERTLLVCELL